MACANDLARFLVLPVLLAALCALLVVRTKRRPGQRMVEWGLTMLMAVTGTWALYAIAVWVLGLFGRGPLGE